MTQTVGSVHQQLQRILDRLRTLAEGRADRRILADLDAADRRLAEINFKLVVLGEYKRGKSTLINALLGEPVLPTGVVPLTSVITEVTYGSPPSARIEFLSGDVMPVAIDSLAQFITEPHNPGNRKRVARAVICVEAALLRQGVVIVDTPGVGSVFSQNTQLTYQFLGEADAMVLVLGADQPLSAEEHRLLAALSQVTSRILFVINRVDVLSQAEREASVQFIREQLAEIDPQARPALHALSARQALEARQRGGAVPAAFADFELALRARLIDQKSQILAERALALAGRAVDLIALHIGSERRAQQLTLADLDAAITQFDVSADAIRQQADEAAVLLRHETSQIYKVELSALSSKVAERLSAELWPRVEQELQARSGERLRAVAWSLAASIGTWVVGDLRAYHRETEQVVPSHFAAALDRYTGRIQAAAEETVALANRLLGMESPIPRIVAPIGDDTRFYFHDWDYAGGPFRGPVWRLRLPRRWAAAAARQLLRELLERRIHQNLEAIRWDWMTRLEDAVRRFEAPSRDQLDAVTEGIREALGRTRDLQTATAVDEARSAARLGEQVAELQAMRQELTRISSAEGVMPNDESVPM